MSTAQLLQSYPALSRTRFQRPLVLGNRRMHAGAMLTLASFGLIGVAVSPDYWYPFLWVSPLLILVSLQVLLSEENLLQKLEQGRVARRYAAGAGGIGMRLFLGDVEPLQLPEVGVLHSICPTI